MLELFTVVVIVIAWVLMVFKMDEYPLACFLIPVVMTLFVIPLNYFGPPDTGFTAFYGVVVVILFLTAIKNLFGDFFKSIIDGFSGEDREIDYDEQWDL